jgi:hypothetical protein
MPRYSLRTLLILLAIGPPLVTVVWVEWQRYRAEYARREFDKLIPLIQTTIVPNSHWEIHQGEMQSPSVASQKQ